MKMHFCIGIRHRYEHNIFFRHNISFLLLLLWITLCRLVKGDGEIVEEIVSRERHAAINKVVNIIG